MSADESEPVVSATPILDSGLLPARVRRKTIAGVVVGLVFGLTTGVVLAKVGEQAYKGLSGDFEILIFVIVITLAITVHELGHLLAGWTLGFSFSSVSIGPLSLSLEHGALKIRFRRDMPALGYAGMHTDGVRRLRHRLLIYIAAGPAANLLSIPATVLLVNYAFPWLGDTWVAAPAAEFVVFSFMSGVLSLGPLAGDFSSDGSRIAMLLRSREKSRRWLSAIAVGSQQRNGVRARHWRETWLKAASSVRDRSVDEFSGVWIAYISANDRKDELSASARLERCLELSPILRPSIRDMIAYEAAVFSAWFRDDVLLADKWASQVKKPKLMGRLLQIRLAAALPCAGHHFDAALDHWREGAIFIDKLPTSSAKDRLRESWQEWQSEILERQVLSTIK